MMFNNTYSDKMVLVTGFAGFKGAWLTLFLKKLGAHVVGYSLQPEYEYSNCDVFKLSSLLDDYVIEDIRNRDALKDFFEKHSPEVVFHLAAQPLVRQSYIDPIYTYETNVIGTLNVLEAARKIQSVKAFVNVTSDKCYELNKKYQYCEKDNFGGHDIYSSSKGCVEILSRSYRNSFLQSNEMLLACARAGNVIAGGDWATDRLVPDCIKSLVNNEIITLRNPNSVRPWQHVFDPIAGYLRLGQMLLEKNVQCASGYNFGPDRSDITVLEVVKNVITLWGGGDIRVIPDEIFYEAPELRLNTDKMKCELDILPILDLESSIKWTVDWYKEFYANKDMLEFSQKQLSNFCKISKKQNAIWS